jgi:hypothetical protein
MVVKHKETGDVRVLTKQDVLDRYQSHLECDSFLSFQEVFSHYNYEIRYSGTLFIWSHKHFLLNHLAFVNMLLIFYDFQEPLLF